MRKLEGLASGLPGLNPRGLHRLALRLRPAAALMVEGMQNAMRHRRHHQPHEGDEDQAAEERVCPEQTGAQPCSQPGPASMAVELAQPESVSPRIVAGCIWAASTHGWHDLPLTRSQHAGVVDRSCQPQA